MLLHQKKENKITTRTLTIEDKEVSLRRKISLWTTIQQIYMPPVRLPTNAPISVDDDDSASSDTVSPVDIPLRLPESLPETLRSSLAPDLLSKYIRLRFAQAEEALSALKRSLKRGAILFQHRQEHTAGTGVAANTRMQSAMANQRSKQDLDAARYRTARAALLILVPSGLWKNRLRQLNQMDVRPPLRKQDESEGRRTLTWIWRVPRAADGVDELTDAQAEEEIDVSLEDVNEGV